MTERSTIYRPRYVVVLCHPEPHGFSGHVADAYCEAVGRCGQEAIVRDLYTMRFDPVLTAGERSERDGWNLPDDIAQERATIESSDVFVFAYPIWFGMPPAMLKGYIDRVLGPMCSMPSSDRGQRCSEAGRSST